MNMRVPFIHLPPLLLLDMRLLASNNHCVRAEELAPLQGRRIARQTLGKDSTFRRTYELRQEDDLQDALMAGRG